MTDKNLEVDDDDHGPVIELDRSLGEPVVRMPLVMGRTSRKPPPPRRAARWPWLLLLVVLGGGAALERTEHGAFFRHSIDALAHADERALLTEETLAKVRTGLGADTLEGSKQALSAVDAAVARAPRHKPLLAWAAYAVFAHELRFARNPTRHAQAVEWLAVANAHPHAVLAAAARELLDHNEARAREKLTREDGEAKFLLGHVELSAKHPLEAVHAFEAAVKMDPSIRTRAALARALEGVDTVRAREAATSIASEAKSHIGARLIVGRIAYATRDSAALTSAVTELGPLEKDATPTEKSELFTLRGLHALERGEALAARAAFDESTKLANGTSSSLNTLGLARALITLAKLDDARAALDSISDPNLTAEVAKLRALTAGKPNKK